MSGDVLQDLVAGEREALVPPQEAKKTTWKRVARSVAMAAPGSAAAGAPVVASKVAGAWVKGLIVLAIGGAVAVGVYGVTVERDAAPVAVSGAAEPAPAVADAAPPAPAARSAVGNDAGDNDEAVPVAPPPAPGGVAVETPPERPAAVPAVASPSPTPRRPEKARASTNPATPPPAAPQSPASALAEEARLIAQARAKLRGEAPRAALAALAEHARRFPGGQLVEERMALSARARCAAGDLDRGRREAAAFRRAFPASSQNARVERACGK